MYPRLQELEYKHCDAFLAAMEDYASGDPSTFALRYIRSKPWDREEFVQFVGDCEKERLDWRPGPGKVSVTHYVLVERQGQICGLGRMRFPLTSETEIEGGNLDFDVPPFFRRQGYGALTLNRMLFEAVRAGLARVLVTAPADDQGMNKVIRKNRGVLRDKIESPTSDRLISRYWIHFR
jgi:predicted acetyltransferase